MKAHHATVSPELKSEKMRNASLARWSKIGKEERRAIALKMVVARIDKDGNR